MRLKSYERPWKARGRGQRPEKQTPSHESQVPSHPSRVEKLWKGGGGYCTATDPYHPRRAQLRVTAALLEVLAEEKALSVCIITKSASSRVNRPAGTIAIFSLTIHLSLITLDRSCAADRAPRTDSGSAGAGAGAAANAASMSASTSAILPESPTAAMLDGVSGA